MARRGPSGWAGARIAVPTVFVFTTLTLSSRWCTSTSSTSAERLRLNTRLVDVVWLAIYGGVPVLDGRGVRRDNAESGWRRRRRAGSRSSCASCWSCSPSSSSASGSACWWPRAGPTADGRGPLTPLTGRAIGAWLVGLGVAAADAVPRRRARRCGRSAPPACSSACSRASPLLRYGDELAWDEAAAYGYVAFLIVLTAVSLWSLLVTGGLWARRPSRRDVRQGT